MNKVTAVFFMAFAGVLTDLLVFGWAVVKSSRMVPYAYKGYLGYVDHVPWQALVYAIFFGCAVAVSLRPRQKVGGTEIAGGVVVATVVQLVLPWVFVIFGPVLAGLPLPPSILHRFVFAFLLALIVRGVYFIEISIFAILAVGFVGAAVTSVGLIQGLPIYPEQFWFTCVALTTGLFLSKYA